MGTIVPFLRAATANVAMPEQTRPSSAQDKDGVPDDVRWADLMLRAQDGDRAAYHACCRR